MGSVFKSGGSLETCIQVQETEHFNFPDYDAFTFGEKRADRFVMLHVIYLYSFLAKPEQAACLMSRRAIYVRERKNVLEQKR